MSAVTAKVDHAVTADNPVLAVRGATKRFGSVLALDDVSIEVRRGEIVGLPLIRRSNWSPARARRLPTSKARSL
ncbi:hypothetical protein NKI39_24920 [Mesorhizobium sp. M0664]